MINPGPNITEGDSEETLRRSHRMVMFGLVVFWVLAIIIALVGWALQYVFPGALQGGKRATLAWLLSVGLAITGPAWIGIYWLFESLVLKRRIDLVRKKRANNA